MAASSMTNCGCARARVCVCVCVEEMRYRGFKSGNDHVCYL